MNISSILSLKNPSDFGWRLALTTDEYRRLETWMSKHRDSGFDRTDFAAWEQILYNRKQFDEDGDPAPFGTVPGMLITEENEKDRRTIISLTEDIRQQMFDLCKEEFQKWNGMCGDTRRSEVYRTYQEQAAKEDRLKGTWTLGQYERVYNEYLADTVRAENPDWQAGEAFAKGLFDAVSREDAEAHIVSDGAEFTYVQER